MFQPLEMLGIWDTDTIICIAHKRLKDVATRCVLRAVNAPPRTPLLELTALPMPPSWIWGISGEGREREGREKKGERRDREGNGRSTRSRTKILVTTLLC